jgi:hypothetical protein
MIESHWENQGHHEEQYQNTLIRCANNQQGEEANKQDHELCRHDIRQNRAHKKSILALEEREAVWAMVPDVKRVRDDCRFATCWTAQSQTAFQHPLDLVKIFFHGTDPY